MGPLNIFRLVDGKEKVVGGLILEFLEYIQSARNCTFTYMRPHDGLWGYCYAKKNCTARSGGLPLCPGLSKN